MEALKEGKDEEVQILYLNGWVCLDTKEKKSIRDLFSCSVTLDFPKSFILLA